MPRLAGRLLLAAAALAFAAPAMAQTAAILIPGAGGPVPSDFLMRNRNAFAGAGVETFIANSPQEAVAESLKLKAAKRRVVMVGMSRGGRMAAVALASGAKVDGVVFVSTGLDDARQRIGSPMRLPPALIVHHRSDGCDLTSPSQVQGFATWSGGRARVAWIDTQGREPPNPCGPRGAHGFYMQDGPAVGAILAFVR
ncbi:MAG: hypothetical protein K2Y29_01725 [Beijerinckiaceae bacterium]|nr:hypothetical protein [Beijerinckiaceae bacterium]